ncbi:hypothetical protein PQR64_08135 [Paraburkholderia phytofirmans]|uniref:hypothetical protein n=1 Tax=Paraburkholderia phytofirmans TaxID=261302 RepID=UPI0038B89C8A
MAITMLPDNCSIVSRLPCNTWLQASFEFFEWVGLAGQDGRKPAETNPTLSISSALAI